MKPIFNYSFTALALLGLALSGCQPELDVPEASRGEADFSKYVAVGNSLTAGYADGGVYREGQQNSFPAILAQQFAMAGGGTFNQPLFSEAQRNGSGYLQLTGFQNGNTSSPILTPVTTQLAYTGQTLLSGQNQLAKYIGPINNYGVPDISILNSTTPAYSALNPYFERLLEAPGTKSYVQFVGESNPTFFTNWIGNNDVLKFATMGGTESPANPFDGLTDTTIFRIGYNMMLDTLARNNAKGVLANIPDVTALPFFTLVTRTAVLASLPPGTPAGTDLWISSSQGNVRPATASDMILLSTRAVIGRPDTINTPIGTTVIPHGFSQFNPLTNAEVLDADEVVRVRQATATFNETIRRAGVRKNLPVADMNQFLSSIQPTTSGGGPIYSYGVANSPGFISGNIFSLDGIHLTPRGNALVANKFIEVINQRYNANIPQVNPNSYRGVKFP